MHPQIRTYQICTRCVMDTSDPDITFNAKGVCHYCQRNLARAPSLEMPPAEKKAQLDELLQKIKKEGEGKEYDCVIGISGGVDSTYVSYLVKKCGLRPLAVHFDNGWNAELAVSNIENTLKKLDIDLHTFVVNWKEFKDIQLAFLRASVPDCEIPTDHAIVALLYQLADRYKLRYILAGTNSATESVMPKAWSQGHGDWKYIRAIHRQFGTQPIKTYPHTSFFTEIANRALKRIQWVSFLDFFDYDKAKAMQTLQNELDWKPYAYKHYESIYTRFYQGYILPEKFGYDKRRGHLSSLINSGQLTREDALEELKKNPYPNPAQLQEDREFVIKKLGISEAEFLRLMRETPKRFEDYPSYANSYLHRSARTLLRTLNQALKSSTTLGT